MKKVHMKDDSILYYKKLNKEVIDCPICQSKYYSVLHNNDRYGMGVQTVICNQCSLIYINPRPTEEEMSVFYKEHYRRFYESIEKPTVSYIKSGPFIHRAEFVINVLNPFLNQANSFLDIGCAEGTLLSLIEREYPKVKTFGIEPSTGFGGYAKQNINGEVFIGSYQEFVDVNSNSKYDVIATTHVLEHILDPKTFLKILRGLMHNGSVLYIEVPNIMDNRVNGIGAIHIGHVLSLAPLTLQILLEKCGFEVVQVFTENLPAKTPAMAVVCKLSNNIEITSYPDKKGIIKKSDWFAEKIIGKSSIINKNSISSILKKKVKRKN